MASATTSNNSSSCSETPSKERQLFNGDRARLQAVLAARGGAASAVDLDSKHGPLGQTVLYAAAWRGHVDCVSDLVEAGADVDAANTGGWTPLHGAALLERGACVSLLLHAGANVAATIDGCTTTTRHIAADMAHEACVSVLAEAGANVDAADENGYNALRRAMLVGRATLGAATSDGSTPLSLAHQCGHSEVVAVLQGESRWRRRRALALIREQREAGSDWRKARKVWRHVAM